MQYTAALAQAKPRGKGQHDTCRRERRKPESICFTVRGKCRVANL